MDICKNAVNAAVNILAVEYLVKTDNREEYGKLIEQLYTLDDYELKDLHLSLSFNMHISNLGEMITQGDYKYQKDELFLFLDRHKIRRNVYVLGK